MARERVAMINVSKDHAHISVEQLFPCEPGFASLNLGLPVVVPFILMGD